MVGVRTTLFLPFFPARPIMASAFRATENRYRGPAVRFALALRPIGRTPGFGPGNPRSSLGGPAPSSDPELRGYGPPSFFTRSDVDRVRQNRVNADRQQTGYPRPTPAQRRSSRARLQQPASRR